MNQKWAVLLFTIGVFMAALDNGIISAALTTINDSFQVSPSWGAWGITLYTLGLAVSVPIVGKLSDRYGRKKLFIIEVLLFGAGSLLVALSQNFPMFLLARLIQSLGGGGIFIIGSSHILTALPKEKQGTALGLLGAMNGIAAVLGPNIGSFILDMTGSWHWLFLINLPIAAVLIILSVPLMRETKGGTRKPLDLAGTVLLSLAILAVMYGITNINGQHLSAVMSDPKVYFFLLTGCALFAGLIFYEKQVELKGGDPILAFSLLKNKVFQWTLFIGFLSGGLLAAVIFIPAYAEQYLHVAPEKAGYWMTPLALASGIGAGLGGMLADRKGPVKAAWLSGVISFAGFLLLSVWVTEKWEFVLASIIAGVGFGFLLGAPLNMLVSEAAKQDYGTALGTLSLVRQMGMTLAPALYAGYITAGYENIGTHIKHKLNDAGMPIKGFTGGETDVSRLNESLSQIPDSKVKDMISEAIHESVGAGFFNLYFTAAVLSLAVIASVSVLSLYRKKQTDTSTDLKKDVTN
ncbi:MFS transporter [Bacillus haynesii]|uniref:MFS transporter n=1 Tax=Bacillus haynesii TaxID=1925021 RepID=UPI00227F94C9|nr:MFS transporter [Bacillus haynesii]MCY7847453.1 MFS transporter [Bacillus haynesii]MCY7998992.1 MFS transporter [Bacillus haynesii]MCY8340090.1 MFS transporter [Bacillus haynesii]MCY8536433.1 MFS transporter [Bacillus haynesii]MEC0635052.1 MFS transporter [Bacillus haynesii]